MNTNNLRRAVSLLIVIPVALTAQLARYRDPVMLKNWAAPLYWQPTQAQQGPSDTPMAATANLPLGANALVFVAMTPCRIADTRAAQGFSGAFGPPSLVGGATGRTFPIQSNTTCPIPAVAQAYSFNLTVVAPAPLGYITAYPTPGPLPLAATLDWATSLIVSNAAIVPAGTNGSVDVYANANTDLVIDINGYYAPTGDLLYNTALGIGSLANNTTGFSNTASGYQALQNNATGNGNTAGGFQALQNNTTGIANTATGYRALQNNTAGNRNTANGDSALQNNTTGGANTAVGDSALQLNTTGIRNTASGFEALQSNTTGYDNTASGYSALGTNATGSDNTASGYYALCNNTTGYYNTASGVSAMQSNTTGADNTASGVGALGSNGTGSNNIAIGYGAAQSVSGSNSNNIHIGSWGAANDSGTIRIGTPGTQTSFFVAGVGGVTTGNNSAIPVVIDSNGQLGTVSSSRRFKEDIQDMGEASSGLLRLRPVTFRYRQPFADGSKPIEYGLIAEEVAEVYPDLVAHSADGQIESVKYQVLDSMLLNELQKEHQQVQQQTEEIRLLQTRLAALEQLLSGKAPAGQ